jgi:hypothetical protein
LGAGRAKFNKSKAAQFNLPIQSFSFSGLTFQARFPAQAFAVWRYKISPIYETLNNKDSNKTSEAHLQSLNSNFCQDS